MTNIIAMQQISGIKKNHLFLKVDSLTEVAIL